MKMLFEQCIECPVGIYCYESGFERCLKIEKAGQGLGIPVKQKDMSWADNIPFGVYMSLKHMITKSKNIVRSPSISITPYIPAKIKYPRVEFAKRLNIETALSYDDALVLVAEIGLYGNIKDAIKCYDGYGLKHLNFYLAGRKALLRNGVD